MANGGEDVASYIKNWMPVLVVLGSLAIAWGSMQTQIDVLADDVTELKSDNDEHDSRESNQQAEVAALRANQEAIKEDVQEIKERQKDQDKKLDKILDELRNQ